ncbi:protein of unknown function [Paraburkholderia kururiensis]|uniref:hypothetical protein n=1 Tax=Paraburkholderia kururiensis TaxID=984307 RepID=UPI0039A495D2
MNSNRSLKGLHIIVPAIVAGALLGGCDRHPRPDLEDVKSALQARYGECPLWTLGNVRRIDGAPNPDGYEVSYSFVLTVKDPDALTGHGAHVSGEDATHIAAAMFGDTSDPCFYGVFPLATIASQQQPVSRSYQVSGDRIFVRSEQGWHLNTAPPNPRDPATYDQFSPIADSTPAAQPGSDADATGTASVARGDAGNGNAAATAAEASTSQLPTAAAAANAIAAPNGGSNVAVAVPVPNPPPAVDAASAVSPASRASAYSPDMPDLEGDWRGTYQCGPYIGQGPVTNPDAWTTQVTMTVHNGAATLVRQSTGGEPPFREMLAGSVLPDRSLPLSGTGQATGVDHPWYVDFMGRFGGSTGAAVFEARGTISDWHRDEIRACRLELSR